MNELTRENAGQILEYPLDEIIYFRLSDFFRRLDEAGGTAARDLYPVVMAQMERPLLKLALEACDGNKCEAARMLGINRNTLLKKMRCLGMPTQPRFWKQKG
jgi:DNA-binding protein Fis